MNGRYYGDGWQVVLDQSFQRAAGYDRQLPRNKDFSEPPKVTSLEHAFLEQYLVDVRRWRWTSGWDYWYCKDCIWRPLRWDRWDGKDC